MSLLGRREYKAPADTSFPLRNPADTSAPHPRPAFRSSTSPSPACPASSRPSLSEGASSAPAHLRHAPYKTTRRGGSHPSLSTRPHHPSPHSPPAKGTTSPSARVWPVRPAVVPNRPP